MLRDKLKLIPACRSLSVCCSPSRQDLAPFKWVLAWAAVMPTALMVSLLERGFFPQWHAVLHHWLSSSPNYDEVTRWYLGWKSLLPQVRNARSALWSA
jgi:GC-rich sequence DNA-binding factor-like protein